VTIDRKWRNAVKDGSVTTFVLPDLYREAFVLRDLEELSTAQVAQALGIESSTVRQRVHRARLMLRGYLSELVGGKP